MRMPKILMFLVGVSIALAVMPVSAAQNPGTDQSQVKPDDRIPIYHFTVNVVERTTKAINYQHRGGATKIDFRGTALLPNASGEAKVESKQGYIEIEVEFDELRSATRFGHEYLTYVMWAITPEGRATNLGEVILNGSRSKLDVTTELQAFGLIVTAEPYFAVSQPSDVVVMENVLRKDTAGKVVEIEAKYELLQRGQYVVNVLPSELKPMKLDKKTPLDLYEARNAVRIADWAGASVYAAESFQKAGALLDQAEDYKNRKSGSRQISMTSREAVQTAEDARLIALQRQEEERLARERAASAERESQANAAAAAARADAEAASRDRARAEADSAAAQAQVERARTDAELAAQRVEREKAEAVAASERARMAAAEQSELARQAAVEQAEREKQELRNKLADQLNTILVTRDSARGLIVEMSDVLFDTGKYSLRSEAREKLAKISGIVLAYPGLKLEVEGHTDSVGSDEYNMKLSENRAGSVRDFLVLQGINTSSITTRGFGESRPVTTNETAAGRQSNRRVELVVSGDPIGKTASLPNR
jgi:outer membrane protein OmpA-like peptidoglycan-associated protein